jgi:hypothetical protein
MKKGCFEFLILCILMVWMTSSTAFAQSEKNGKIISFHPSIGNSIELKEKQEYELFPEYSDSLFESAELIKFDSSNFEVKFKTKNAKSFNRPITTAQLDEIYYAIDRRQPLNQPTLDEKNELQEIERKRRNAEIARNVAEISLEAFFYTLQFIFIIIEMGAY